MNSHPEQIALHRRRAFRRPPPHARPARRPPHRRPRPRPRRSPRRLHSLRRARCPRPLPHLQLPASLHRLERAPLRHPAHPHPTERPSWQRHTAWATATLSMALGFAFINATHQFSILNTPQPAPVAATSPQLARVQQPTLNAPALTETASASRAPRAVQIAADNHMLQAIDASLAPSTDSPAALGLQPAAAPNPGPPASLQD